MDSGENRDADAMKGPLARSGAFVFLAVALCLGQAAAALSASPPPAPRPPPPVKDRWESAIRDFEAQDRKQPPAPDGIVFVGSSSIRLWKLTESFPGLEAINRGFGGSQLADSVRYADRIVTAYRPKLVVLYAGDNDLAAGRSPEQVFADFKHFVAKVHAALPKTRILYIGIKPSLSRWKLIDKIRDANRRIKSSRPPTRDWCSSTWNRLSSGRTASRGPICSSPTGCT